MTDRKPQTVTQLLEQAMLLLGGSTYKFADAVGLKQPSIHSAMKAGSVSAELARQIHLATGGKVAAWELRPDLWMPGSKIPGARA